MKRTFLVLVTATLGLMLLSSCTPAPVPTVTLLPIQGCQTPPLLLPTPLPPTPTTIPATSTPSPVVPLEPADWPMFRFGLDRSGYNPTEVVLKPPLELKWEFKSKSKI